MAINAAYQKDMPVALPGMVADTSRYNIDGACVNNGEADIRVGAAVTVSAAQSVDGHKLIEAMSAGKVPYGVVIRSHWQAVNKNGEMVYENADACNVMSSGRVWMLSKSTAAPTFGAAVKLDNDGIEKSDGAVTTTWTYAGGFYKFGELQLVEVQLHQM